ncbi:MAG: hypothetical protein PHS47_03180 [Methanocellales archaeon]|nr:hypothetical protein [Methanocellales archaeon]MDD5446742.1 hypothetical protein [Methanocellales archaeon]
MSEISYGDIITNALKKDAFSKRSLPMIGLSILGALIITSVWFFFLEYLIENFRVITMSPQIMLLELLPWGLLIFLLIIILSVLELFVEGIIIKQVGEDAIGKQVSLMDALDFTKGKILSLVGATLLIVFVSFFFGLVSIVPYVGSVLNFIVSILIALAVFVTYPYIILGENGAIDSISASIHHFMENKSQVFIVWLLSTVVSLIAILIFAVPFVIAIILFVSQTIGLSPPDLLFPPDILSHVRASMPIFLIPILILAVGGALITVFQYGVMARYYAEAILENNT